MGCSGGVSFATEMRFSGAFGARVVWQVAGGGRRSRPGPTRGGMRPYFAVSMRAMEPFVGLASGGSEFQPLDFMGLAEKVIIVKLVYCSAIPD